MIMLNAPNKINVQVDATIVMYQQAFVNIVIQDIVKIFFII